MGDENPDNVKELADKTGVLKVLPAIEGLVAKHFFRVVLSAYWKGAREAYDQSSTPLHAKELSSMVDELIADHRAILESQKDERGIAT
ncbi:MAG: hypothetical protein O3C69_03615 [Chloroflexi bacterium]|nr:hypothetical protein [Chloroflexota bacterium]